MSYILVDPSSERAVLAGICRYGYDVYIDVADILNSESFSVDTNQILYKCVKSILDKGEVKSVDLASIYATAHELGFSYVLEKKEENKHLNSILSLPINKENVRRFATKIRKLQIARLLHAQLGQAQDKIIDITGNESITHIIGIAEDSIFDFTSLLNDQDSGPQLLLGNVEENLKFLAENKVEQIGISTGYPVYDRAIGGGLRPGVSIVGARMKVGKSQMCLNIGIHVAKNIAIPTLYIDTEMTENDQKYRAMASLTEVEINDIETGKFSDNPEQYKKLTDKAREVKHIPFYHKQIAGMPFEDQLAIMRRWLVKEVGLHPDGKAKPCVILYDYLKLMTSENISNDMKEYQLLGFMMTSLHNFAIRYNVPIFSTIQLNRDGITKESTDVIGASDRIGMFCNNFSIYKKKSDEEIAEDGPLHGNRKLVPVICRHGGGLDDGDYINMIMQGKFAKIIEGRTKLEIKYAKNDDKDGFVVNDEDDNEIVPFE